MKATKHSSLDLSLFWRGDRIALRCLDRPGEVSLGDRPGSLGQIPGVGEGFVVARRSARQTLVCIPPSTMGTIQRREGPLASIEGPAEITLAPGEELSLVFGDFTLRAAASTGEPLTLPRGWPRASAVWGPIAAAALAHIVVLGLAAQAAQAHDAEEGEDEQPDELRSLLISAEERMLLRAPRQDDGPGGLQGDAVDQRAGDGRAGGGARAGGKAGSMGAQDSHAGRQARFAVARQHPKEDELRMSREEALAEARQFGMIGVARRDALHALSTVSPWARATDALGADPLAARGSMWGDWQGSSQGYEGLELSGIGEGGGGKGEGIGLGSIGTLGHGFGRPGDGTGGAGSPDGHTFSHWGDRAGTVGIGRGSAGRGHGLTSRRKTWPTWGGGYGGYVSGRLPPESILRILRQNLGRARLCYENGLRRNPALAGRVVVRFIIGRDGAVTSSADGGSTLPDPEVVSCIVRAFYGLSFPAPEDGIVTATYPIVLSPD